MTTFICTKEVNTILKLYLGNVITYYYLVKSDFQK